MAALAPVNLFCFNVTRLLTWVLVVLAALLTDALFLTSAADAQQKREVYQISSPADSVIILSSNFLDPASLALSIPPAYDLTSTDFRLDTAHSSIILTPQFLSTIFSGIRSGPAVREIVVQYYALPIDIKREYALLRRRVDGASLPDSAKRVVLESSSPQSKGLFSDNFQRSGSITRGFQVGSSKDLSLTSGFNLQFSGELGDDVTVTGALTEEATPIQPEGNTERLREVDKVFITLEAAKHFSATFGDFFVNLDRNDDAAKLFQTNHLGALPYASELPTLSILPRFASLNRKVLGAEVSAYNSFGRIHIVGASNKGTFTSNTLQGEEGFQGPYRLSGKNGERAIIIVAGTERVYVNGELLVRGERNDYVIDYGLGELRFQPRKLITAASRITVDFEYNDLQYGRTLFAGTAHAYPLGSALFLSASYIREGDDPNSTLNLSLSDSDRSALAQAGENALLASRSGVRFVGRDSAGRALGRYRATDTTIDSSQKRFYTYEPGGPNSLYDVTFGFRSDGKGNYDRISIGQFRYTGSGVNAYDTLVYLPMPQLNQIVDVHMMTKPIGPLVLEGEFAGSLFQPNRFAQSVQHPGNAWSFSGRFADSLRIGKTYLGNMRAAVSHESVDEAFRPLDRYANVELQRIYGRDQAAGTGPTLTGHQLEQAELNYSPWSRTEARVSAGRLLQQNRFSSRRILGAVRQIEDSAFVPNLLLQIERISTADSLRQARGEWRRNILETSKNFNPFAATKIGLGLRLAEEEKMERPFAGADTLRVGSFHTTIASPFIEFASGTWLRLRTEYETRRDDSLGGDHLVPAVRSNTGRLTLGLLNLGGFSTALDLSIRQRDYLDAAFSRRSGGNRSSLLLRFEPRYQTPTNWLSTNLLYEISNERSAKIERIFLPVPKGQGTYKYLGDLNGNGIADADEFSPARYSDEGDYILFSVPTETLLPTNNLRTNLSLRIAPQSLLGAKSLLSSMSLDAYFRIEEKSSNAKERDVFLLNIPTFQRDSTTLQGLIEQEYLLHLFEQNTSANFLLRYDQRRNASSLTTGLERRLRIERSLTGRFRVGNEWSNESQLSLLTDAAQTPAGSFEANHDTRYANVRSELSFHPLGSRIDYGLRLEGGLGHESRAAEARSKITTVALRGAYSLQSKTRITAELARDEVVLQSDSVSYFLLPYALTQGRSLGITWLWKLALDYDFRAGIIFTISYDARNARDQFFGNAERRTIHNARAEVRATF